MARHTRQPDRRTCCHRVCSQERHNVALRPCASPFFSGHRPANASPPAASVQQTPGLETCCRWFTVPPRGGSDTRFGPNGALRGGHHFRRRRCRSPGRADNSFIQRTDPVWRGPSRSRKGPASVRQAGATAARRQQNDHAAGPQWFKLSCSSGIIRASTCRSTSEPARSIKARHPGMDGAYHTARHVVDDAGRADPGPVHIERGPGKAPSQIISPQSARLAISRSFAAWTAKQCAPVGGSML
ncbi:hypothetical protein SAMN05518861_11670 [Mesorhizobium sp. YR577]|nr:hypothetical protein SAMN05518861_11670 [Mesorhizobium sp. YR577]